MIFIHKRKKKNNKEDENEEVPCMQIEGRVEERCGVRREGLGSGRNKKAKVGMTK